MSAASSGGVSSSVSWTAAMISASGASIARRTSWLVSVELARQAGQQVAAADLGLELVARAAIAEPTASLIASALCEPIAIRCSLRM